MLTLTLVYSSTHGSSVVKGGATLLRNGFHNDDLIRLVQCDVHDKTFCPVSDLESDSFCFIVQERRNWVLNLNVPKN
jgi:hypothetical protein